MKENNFTESIYDLARLIPAGQVTTYGTLAAAAGHPRAARAVGNAMNHNPYAPAVPCHRVIKSDGSVGGFAHGQAAKIKLLEKEGIVIEGKRIDLAKYQYGFRIKK